MAVSFERMLLDTEKCWYDAKMLRQNIYTSQSVQHWFKFKRIKNYNVVIMQRCWTRITVIIATWLKFKQRFPFGVPLQTSSFLHCVVTYTVCLLVACYATKKKIILLKATSIGLLVKYLRLVKIWFGLVCSPRTSAHRRIHW